MAVAGRIAAIWRYPVKSMRGEELASCSLGSLGIPGDRAWALRDEEAREMRGGKKRYKERKLYPGYIIVEMDLTDDVWYMIKETSGIGDFVGSYQKPIPLSPPEVEKILNTLKGKDESPEVKIDLTAGDGVKIKEGPFENFDGVVDETFPAKGTVRVIVTIFGRATPVDLEYWQVEKI